MEKDKNVVDLRRFWRAVKQTKYVYLALLILFGSAAGFMVYRMMPKVPVSGEMLIGEESMSDGGAGMLAAAKGAGGMSQMLKTFSVGGFGGAAVDNEVLVLASHDVMLRTAKTLNLNRTYIGKGEDGKRRLLWRNEPVRVEAPEAYFDTLQTAYNLNINILPDGKVDVVAKKGLLGTEIAKAEGLALPAVFKTPYGELQLLKGENFADTPYKELKVGISGNTAVAIDLTTNVGIDVKTKLSDVIVIDYECANPELGKAIVNGVMTEYNKKRLDRIHETAVNSIKYYDERIAETLKQLENAEQKVADYKRSTTMSAIEAEAQIMAEMTAEGKAQVMATKHTIDYYQKVLNSLKGDLSADVLIPSVATVSDTTIYAYNQLVMQRRDLRRSATENNTTLVQLNQKISSLASLIEANAEQYISKAKSDLVLQSGLTGMASSRIDKYPDMELDFTVLARNKEFQNALYLYLVQARENAVLKMYADTDLGFVFQPAYVTKAGLPIKSILLIVAALFFAVVVATFVAILVMKRSQKLRHPMDLAFMNLDHSTVMGVSDDSMVRMRTKLMANENIKLVYMANLANDASLPSKLIQSFRNAGLSVDELTAESNDLLISHDFNKKVAESQQQNDYIFIDVPTPSKLFGLENEIDKVESAVVVFVPQTMTRGELKKILSGQTINKVKVVIAD